MSKEIKKIKNIKENEFKVWLTEDMALDLIKEVDGCIPWQFGKIYNLDDVEIKQIYDDYKSYIPWQFGKEFNINEMRELFKLLDL